MKDVNKDKFVELKINPRRVCFGLSRIGYTPPSAICDIVDNAITAKATIIDISIVKENDYYNDNRINNVKEYIIRDNGVGMNESEILNALQLGASDLNYDENTLSKFGLGLKSAAFSQGNIIEVISLKSEEVNKYILDMNVISDKYVCKKSKATEEERQYLNEYKSGTIIKIKDIHKNNHPSIKDTISKLKEKLGVIYYYFLKDGLVKLFLEGEEIEPIDILFTDKAQNKLDEQIWSGKEVSWIYEPKEFILEKNSTNKVTLEVTQLPYPPIFEIDGDVENKSQIRDIYRIDSKNYGVYVYRNKRLISWAENFDGLIPRAQNLYAFRARLNIDSNSDDMFNIDVKKSNIILSEEARESLDDILDDLKRKSRKAWDRMTKIYNERRGEDSNKAAIDIVKGMPRDIDPLENRLDRPTKQFEDEKVKREKEIEMENSENDPKNDKNEEDRSEDTHKNDESKKKIKHVDFIEDNMLFEHYYDASENHCIKINKNHRFSKLLYGDNSDNKDMQIMFELFYFNMMLAERSTQVNMQDYERETIKVILDKYREALSILLTNMCRDVNKLPPNKEKDD